MPVKRLGLKQRRTVFAELVALQDSQTMTVPQTRDIIRKHYGLTSEALLRIENEGIDCEWYPLNEAAPPANGNGDGWFVPKEEKEQTDDLL
jgi:hypothetical protein